MNHFITSNQILETTHLSYGQTQARPSKFIIFRSEFLGLMNVDWVDGCGLSEGREVDIAQGIL